MIYTFQNLRLSTIRFNSIQLDYRSLINDLYLSEFEVKYNSIRYNTKIKHLKVR